MDDHSQVTIVVQNLIFYNTPPLMIIKDMVIVSLKTLPVKPNGTKHERRKKKVQYIHISFLPIL